MNTLDYTLILEGEIWLLTDKDEVLLKAGDTAICRGANHHWNNRTEKPCVAIVVSIGAEPLEPPHPDEDSPRSGFFSPFIHGLDHRTSCRTFLCKSFLPASRKVMDVLQ